VANCGLVQILGVGDTETAEHTEKLLGKCTILAASTNSRGERSTSQTARPLLMQDELRRLEEDRQIVFIGNLQPMKLKKTAYWQRPDLDGRYHRNPYFDTDAPGVSGADDMAATWGGIYRLLVLLMAPHCRQDRKVEGLVRAGAQRRHGLRFPPAALLRAWP
jgi:type IV secretion system protein VirD4